MFVQHARSLTQAFQKLKLDVVQDTNYLRNALAR